jgi:hypothetical protein
MITSRALRTMILGPVFAALACGERAPSGDADTAGVSTGTPDSPPTAAGDAAVPVPASLARACLAGDPEEGVAWSLDSVALDALPLTGIEALASRDSARLAARIARMVDVIPSDTSIADFRGLPVSVRAAWRLVPAEGDTVVVALVARRMPIESAPLEELFTIVSAPGVRSGVRDPLVGGWFVRDAGPEESLVARELVAAYRRDAELVLAFVEHAEGGVRAALVERRAMVWQPAWSGPLPVCPPR